MKFSIRLALSFLFFLLLNGPISSQTTINQIEPPHWWIGMENDTLHLLVYGTNLFPDTIYCDKSKLSILDFRSSKNGSYLFIDLLLTNTKPGEIVLKLQSGKKIMNINYFFKERRNGGYIPMGLDQSDLIYLLMPDRFANGNPKNDAVKGMKQTGIHRDSLLERHGGDIQGINEHLDYLKDLGVSALWLNPVETNDQPEESYHGYAISDHYAIDPRLGNNEVYNSFCQNAHSKEIKIIRDVIFNHFGNEHPLCQNPPDSSWINQWDEYTKTTYRATVRLDPHASEGDKRIFSDGWFDKHMPDMNYRNKDLSHYMIQNSIWWIEEFGIDAYRIDTYIYPDQGFMKQWAKELKKQYPSVFLFAETWVHGSAIQAWFAGGNRLGQGETYLDGVTDFQMYYAINNALSQDYGWNQGISNVYYKLVDDVLYANPENNVLFLDNHDLDRFYGVNEDLNKFKIGVGLLFTLRGIPSIQYGTEILMPYKGSHGLIRSDFPGGWEGDEVDKFKPEGRSEMENEAFNYIKKLAKWRSSSEAIKEGELIQFIPKEEYYVFSRLSEKEVVLVVVNQDEETLELPLSDYDEVLHGMRNFYAPLEQKSYSMQNSLSILPQSIQILSFKIGDKKENRNFNNRIDQPD